MAKAIALYQGGIHNLVEVAVRTDGRVFERWQSKGMYGYQWSAWKATSETMGENMRANPPTSRSAGFSTLWLFRGEKIRRRLP